MSIWLLRSALIQPKKGFQEFEDHNAFKISNRIFDHMSSFRVFSPVFGVFFAVATETACRSHVERFVDSVQTSDRMPVHEALQSVLRNTFRLRRGFGTSKISKFCQLMVGAVSVSGFRELDRGMSFALQFLIQHIYTAPPTAHLFCCASL
jgi:hypothetical protein